MPWFWLVIYHGKDTSSAIRFRVPGQFGLAWRTYRAAQKLGRNPHLRIEW